MKLYSLTHLSNETLLRDLATLVARERISTAQLLAHLAEVDARQLYLPAGYSSMYIYCVQELRLSEDAALKRIRVARKAREFPALFAAIADGRLNLNGVVLLASHLTQQNAQELIAGASSKTRSEIEGLLAERCPRSEALPIVCALPGSTPEENERGQESGEAPVEQLAARPVGVPHARAGLAPIARQRHELRVTMSQETHDKLRHAQALLGHRIPNGNLTEVLDRVLSLAIEQLEKNKFAATTQPRSSQRRPNNPRTIPAQARRTVWKRDNGRCTFISDVGHRCVARDRLEFDHIVPLARGGQATVENLRLRCRAHNQYEASATFGAEFMTGKREEARERAAVRRRELAKERAREVIPWLRALGFRAEEARWRAERCEAIPEASLEDRVRLALSHVGSMGRSARNGAAPLQ